MSACSAGQCDGVVIARGLCQKHYKRLKRHGDPLSGRTPRGLPERALADALLHLCREECLIWPFARNDHGYAVISRELKMVRVSRIICEHANGPPPTQHHEAAHNCGRGHDGCINRHHLRWATSAENKADMVLHGTSNRGERQGSSKLTEANVLAIRRSSGSVEQQVMAAEYGVSDATISNIIHRKTWAWL